MGQYSSGSSLFCKNALFKDSIVDEELTCLQCGTCWSLTYNDETIYVLAIDHTAAGFNIAEAAMNNLTDGNAEQFGRVDATFAQVGLSYCNV